MKMKLLLLLILIPLKASALNRTYLLMPPDREYMNFVMAKFLKWHEKNFSFPEKSPLLDELVWRIDHFVVKDSLHRQLTFSHGLDAEGKETQTIRLYIHPELRKKKEFFSSGLPDNEKLRFIEWDMKGHTCQLYQEEEKVLSSWCRNPGKKKFEVSWTETEAKDFPEGWPMPFPRSSIDVILKKVNGKIVEVTYFQISAHPSRVPEVLLRSVFLHTKDALFPLERISMTVDGKMTVQYP